MKEHSETNSSEKDTKKSQLKSKSFFLSNLEEFLTFARVCSNSSSGIEEVLSLLFVVQSLLGHFLLSKTSLSTYISSFLSFVGKGTILYRVIQISIYIMSVVMIVSICLAKLKNKNTIWFTTVKRLITAFDFISKVLLFLNAIFLFLAFEENIPMAILSVLISMFNSLFLGNYYLRKEENYQTSSILSLVLKIGTITNLLGNCVIVRIGSFQGYCLWGIAFGVFILVWHPMGGFRLFVRKFRRRVLLLFCSLTIANSLIFFVRLLPSKHGLEFNWVEWGVSIVVVSFYLYSSQQKKRLSFVKSRSVIKELKVKDYDLDLLVLFEEAEDDTNLQCFLTGILFREIDLCQKAECWKQQQTVYDPQLKHIFSPKDIKREKDSLRRFYMRCVYVEGIQNDLSQKTLINFVEFGISQHGDYARYCLAFERINDESLSFLQKIQVCNLRLLLKEQADAFNRLIHGGKIEIDQIISAEKTYQDIQNGISRYCQESLNIWSQSLKNEIDIFSLKSQLGKNLELLPQITEQWNSISKMLTFNQRWRFVYLNFALFLKNEKIRNRSLNFSEDPISNLSYSETEPLNSSMQKTLQQSTFFDEKTALFTCTFSEKELRFFQTSHNFEKITGFSPHQVQDSPLNIILPPKLKETHDASVNDWLQKGYSIHEGFYPFKNTCFMTKNGDQVPALVAFKLYVNLACPEKLLNFGCLLHDIGKKTQDSSMTALTHRSIEEQEEEVLEKFDKHESNGLQLRLEASCNIFLKEENLQPVPANSEIRKLKIVMRVAILLLIFLILGLSLKLNTDLDRIEKDGKIMNIWVNIYNYSLGLARLYMNYFTTPSKDGIVSAVQVETVAIKKIIHHPLATETVFNSKLNPPVEYQPFDTNSINEGIALSSSDIFYSIYSSITTLSYNTRNMSQFEFIQLHSYIKPGFDNMMNTTKQLIHLELQQNLHALKTNQIITISIYASLLLLIAVYLLWTICRYFANMEEIMDIVVQFSSEEVKKIALYWLKVKEHFANLTVHKSTTLQHKAEDKVLEKSDLDLYRSSDKRNSASLNQKHKNLIFSEQEKKKGKVIIFLMIFLMVVFVGMVIGKQIINYKAVEDLIQFEQAGWSVIQHFPISTITAYAFGHCYFTSKYPKKQPIFNFTRFESTMTTLQIVIDYQYIKEVDQDSTFLKKHQNYFFGNPCTYNPQLLIDTSTDISMCTGAGGGTLSDGILAFLRHIQPILINFFQGKISISPNDLKEISIGLKLVSYFISDEIKDWSLQFEQKVDDFAERNMLHSLFLCLLLVILSVVIFQLIIIPKLTKDYVFLKNVFLTCVPEHILAQQKVIKHRFIKSGIIN